jgi:hypothetical protein
VLRIAKLSGRAQDLAYGGDLRLHDRLVVSLDEDTDVPDSRLHNSSMTHARLHMPRRFDDTDTIGPKEIAFLRSCQFTIVDRTRSLVD